jgi:hypothetical protein
MELQQDNNFGNEIEESGDLSTMDVQQDNN